MRHTWGRGQTLDFDLEGDGRSGGGGRTKGNRSRRTQPGPTSKAADLMGPEPAQREVKSSHTAFAYNLQLAARCSITIYGRRETTSMSVSAGRSLASGAVVLYSLSINELSVLCGLVDLVRVERTELGPCLRLREREAREV